MRVCDATYDKAPIEKEGIQVLDWPFDDGAPPPNQIVDDWLNLLKTKFREEPGCCVAVHCVAGLGRLVFRSLLFILHLMSVCLGGRSWKVLSTRRFLYFSPK